MSTRVTETCSCGATFEIVTPDSSWAIAPPTLGAWRSGHAAHADASSVDDEDVLRASTRAITLPWSFTDSDGDSVTVDADGDVRTVTRSGYGRLCVVLTPVARLEMARALLAVSEVKS
jgi:hypothetical protein